MATLDDINAEVARREIARRSAAAKAPTSTAPISSDGGGPSDAIGAGVAGLQRSVLGGLGLEPGDIEGSVAALLHPHVPSLDDLTPNVSKREAAMALAEPVLALSSAPIKAARSLIRSVNPDAYDEQKAQEGARLGAEENLSPLAARIGFALPIATAAAEQGPALARSARATLSTPAVADKIASGLDAVASAAPAAGRVVGGAAGLVKGPVGAYVGYKGGGKLGDTVAKGASKLADKLRASGALSDWVRPLAEPQSAEAVSSGLDLAREPQTSTADIADQLDLLKAKAGLGGRADVTGQLQAMARDAGLLPSGLDLARDVVPAPFEPATVGGHPDEVPGVADDKAAEMAQSLDPGGEDWKRWLLEKPAERTPRPELDAAQKILETKTGAGGVSAYKPEGIGTPTGARIGRDLVATEHPEDFEPDRRSAVERLLSSDRAPVTRSLDAMEGAAHGTFLDPEPTFAGQERTETLSRARAPSPSTTRELNLPELRDQQALAFREGRPTAEMDAIRSYVPSRGADPSLAELHANDAAREKALQSIDQPKPPPSTTFQGDSLKLADQVSALPPAKRAAFIHQIAAQFGKKTALNVAKAAGVSLKLNPL